MRQVARHRFIASGSIAKLVNRSIDRTNDRLMRLYHAGYIDRPRAQLDRFPTSGSACIVYALADRGVRLLRERDGLSFANPEWSRKNREAGRPFIEHQIEIAEFQVALERAARERGDVQLLHQSDILAVAPAPTREARNPFLVRAKISHQGLTREIGVVPDLVFGFRFADGSRRCFMVEIDRGTMPITRTDINQTSFERKLRVYLAAHSTGQHQRQFGWKTFRVLTVTSDQRRLSSLIDAAKGLWPYRGLGSSLFLFASVNELLTADPIKHAWRGTDRTSQLL
ncbi:MAG TPA: replication-relaxation family protein [Candidatus Eremiobacteraceae bacterium]|nr:replication-relaxation family protein [Candidatus Eremiobacteraceae bacterium]